MPDTPAGQFLSFAWAYVMIPVLIILVLWFLNKMQKRKYAEVEY